MYIFGKEKGVGKGVEPSKEDMGQKTKRRGKQVAMGGDRERRTIHSLSPVWAPC